MSGGIGKGRGVGRRDRNYHPVQATIERDERVESELGICAAISVIHSSLPGSGTHSSQKFDGVVIDSP